MLSQVRDIALGYKLHQISAPISEGSSGSPVFNLEGEVIGIATLSDIWGQNLNFSVPINYVKGMISETPKMTLAEFSKAKEELGGPYTIQICVYEKKDEAEKLVSYLKQKGYPA